MKHNFSVTLILIALFILAQLIGLVVISHYSDKDLPYGVEKPAYEPQTSFIPLSIFIVIATVIALLLAKFKATFLWKIWFLFAVIFGLSISFSVVFPPAIALITAIILGLLKIYYRTPIIHNFTEIFIYGGIISLFAPVFNIFSSFILLILISLYDMYAVWKSKHMIKLAKFQTKLKTFAGLFIPYAKNKVALLGGGDIAFPLLFAGAVLLQKGLYSSILVIIYSALALTLLFLFGKKKKFYPAMPFISLGCFTGYLISLI
ncbi:MAG TPA: presenilin family intramembrane aspartyl protease [Candidatus Nanoarchaeia archaeon]|nr:presenilin family intramembrane aspartyl protease [Candidatus Nanoarchaeia archaeon]